MNLKSKFTHKLRLKLSPKFKQLLTGLMALILVIATTSPSISQGNFNYGEALQKSILFYEAQQTGELPEWNRFPWRGDSTPEDGADVGVDLTGGWVDAGDNVKFNFPLAFAVVNLAWGGIEYYDAYQGSDQLEHLTQNIKWATDYLLNSFANDDPGSYVLYGQVGNGELDHKWWGSLEVVHYEMERPAYKIDTSCPGTDLAAETSAALASSSIFFRQNGDTEYANLLLEKAEKLFDFADTYRGKYSDCLTAANPFYTSRSGYQDELVWGAIWLHKAKQAQGNSSGTYLAKAESEYVQMSKPFDYTYQFDDKSYGVYVLLAQATGKEEYQQRAEAWLDFWTIGHQGQRITYTPGGLAFLVKWASLPLSANTSFVAFIYSDWLKSQGEISKAQRYFDFGVSQINYILGENPAQRSYLIGYGQNSPQNPHHRTAHGSWLNNMTKPSTTHNILIGALVGGPDQQDNWLDDRTDWVRNEVGVGYNAGFTGALAKMYSEFGGEPLPEISFAEANENPATIYVESQVTARRRSTRLDLALVNQSHAPARGIENPSVRIFYQTNSPEEEDIAISVKSPDCPAHSISQPVKLEDGTYYTQISCQETVIYPGGEEDYKKQLLVEIAKKPTNNNNLLGNLNSLFKKPAQITKICFFDGEQLLWESDF